MASRTTVDHRPEIGLRTLDSIADAVEDLRSFVTISRAHPSDVGEREVFVRLDTTRAKLLYGQCFTIEVAPGTHRLRVHNTLVWKNVPFTLESGEHLEFLIVNSGRWWTWGMAGLLGSAPLFLRVEKRSRL